METKKLLPRDRAKGRDTCGNEYASVEDMWEEELTTGVIGSRENWYALGNMYWSVMLIQSKPATVETVIGFEEIHHPDISASTAFLEMLIGERGLQCGKALDCGAGIGRVTKHVLEPKFAEVDLVDQSEVLLGHAREYIESSKPLTFTVCGLQSFTPRGSYDCVWVQWVSSQLTDSDLISFYRKAASALKPGGYLVVKENIKKKGFLVHKDDFSVTRSEDLYRLIFASSDLQIIAESLQPDFPDYIYQVKMWALQPQLH